MQDVVVHGARAFIKKIWRKCEPDNCRAYILVVIEFPSFSLVITNVFISVFKSFQFCRWNLAIPLKCILPKQIVVNMSYHRSPCHRSCRSLSRLVYPSDTSASGNIPLWGRTCWGKWPFRPTLSSTARPSCRPYTTAWYAQGDPQLESRIQGPLLDFQMFSFKFNSIQFIYFWYSASHRSTISKRCTTVIV